MYVRDGWSDITGSCEWHAKDMNLCYLLESAASIIDQLRDQQREMRDRNVRLMSKIQEMEVREQ